MNEMYAISPACLNLSARDMRAVLKMFGLQEGRFVADFPKQWIGEVLSNYQRGTKQFADIAFLLLKAKDALVELDEPYRHHKSWEENVLEVQSHRRRFQEIFSDAETDTLRRIDVLVDSLDFELKDGREDFLLAEAQVYSQICRPLFFCSEEIVLHDYFFSLRREDNGSIDFGRLRVLKALLQEMVRIGRVKRFLILFNRKFESMMGEHVMSDLDSISAECDPSAQVELIYDFNEMGAEGGSRHPRCIFSVKGGLQFDQGFQVFKNGDKNLVRWMSAVTLRPFQQEFLRLFHR
jgi:hypothetical protein